ncbi:PEP-CTERM sorting domain-containing protein [Novipirellula artificiosorum]|uniref:Ice-binding protein C-terminal domain-containing protein n=1 Tax=Novipirellula artificiosorum TaxID=2528016 RepID=A0A5C6DEH6_9BACT|nr:PEP-CTERM sorting domain-containing protein [Novipirellula artificiosorum]TWU35068.1 hypothetical protein Poly41_42120 [Novipirellula artificiosorum]
MIKSNLLRALAAACLAFGINSGNVDAAVVKLTGGDASGGWVLDSGNVLLAANLGAASAVTTATVQGVSFTPLLGPAPWSVTAGSITLSVQTNSSAVVGPTPAPGINFGVASGDNTGLETIGNTYFSHFDTPITLTFSGLNASANYRIDHILSNGTAPSTLNMYADQNGDGVRTFYENVVTSPTFPVNPSDFGVYLSSVDATSTLGGVVSTEAGNFGTGGFLNAVVISEISAVPEPTSLAALAVGTAALAIRRRRRARKA